MSGYASVVTSRDSDADIDLGVNYSANRFQVIADHATRMESLNEDIRNHSTRVEVSSAIAFAGSSITVGRPVREALQWCLSTQAWKKTMLISINSRR